MQKESLLQKLLFISSFLLTVWGVVGIIYTSLNLNYSSNTELYGQFYEIVIFTLEVFAMLIAFLFIKFKKYYVGVISLVFSLLMALIALVEVFIFAVLIYGAIKGTSLNGVSWFDWAKLIISFVLCLFYFIIFIMLYKYLHDIEKDKKENSGRKV